MRLFAKRDRPSPTHLEQAQAAMLQDYREQLKLERDRITALLALAVNPAPEPTPPQPFLDRVRYAYAVFRGDMTITGVVAEEYLDATLHRTMTPYDEDLWLDFIQNLWNKEQWKGATPALWESEFNGTPIKIIRIEP
jgi:hypothetical protein